MCQISHAIGLAVPPGLCQQLLVIEAVDDLVHEWGDPAVEINEQIGDVHVEHFITPQHAVGLRSAPVMLTEWMPFLTRAGRRTRRGSQ